MSCAIEFAREIIKLSNGCPVVCTQVNVCVKGDCLFAEIIISVNHIGELCQLGSIADSEVRGCAVVNAPRCITIILPVACCVCPSTLRNA